MMTSVKHQVWESASTHTEETLDVPGFGSEVQCPCLCGSQRFLVAAGQLQRFSVYKSKTISAEVNKHKKTPQLPKSASVPSFSCCCTWDLGGRGTQLIF